MHFDYIVIGAGSAGCAVATRLSEDARNSVLLIEAGDDDQWIWLKIPLGVGFVLRSKRAHTRYFTEPEPHLGGRKIFWPRGKVLGGTSEINGMIWVRGDPVEYDRLAEGGIENWSYADVEKVFRHLESFQGGGERRGAVGPVHIREYSPRDELSEAFRLSCLQAGIRETSDYNSGAYEGVAYIQCNVKSWFRHGAREAFLYPARARKNLHITTNAFVTRILLKNGRATGVELEVGGEKKVINVAKDIVCSAGAIQTPQLLELSGIGNASILRRCGISVMHHLPGVGENCHDHLMTRLSYRCAKPITLNDRLNNPLRKMAMGLRYILRQNGMLSTSTATIHAITRSTPAEQTPDIKLQLHHLSSEDPRDPNKWRWDPYPGFGIGTYVLKPKSRGSVHIRSGDPHQPPAMSANYLSDEEDRKKCIAALRWARTVAEQPALKALIVEETRPGRKVQSDDELLAHAAAFGQTCYHPIGTSRMGSDFLAVVDSRLRVRGIRGLRIADASVMPTQVSSNTNAVATMVGERCAQFIMEDVMVG